MHQSPSRYTNVIIALHWLTFILIVVSYASIEFRGIFEKGTEMRENIKYLHFMVGLSVLVLTLLRVSSRLVSAAPAPSSQAPDWMNTAAKLGHLAIYAFLIVMPVLGWMIVSAEGKSLTVFGATIPALLAENKDLAHQLEEIHETIGKFGYALLGGHILMAIYHQRILKDDIMSRIKR